MLKDGLDQIFVHFASRWRRRLVAALARVRFSTIRVLGNAATMRKNTIKALKDLHWLPLLARFEVALFSSLSPKYIAKKDIYAMILIVQYLGERAGERGRWNERPPHPDPLPHEFANNCSKMGNCRCAVVGERGKCATSRLARRACIPG
jgi:hypothetical protein